MKKYTEQEFHNVFKNIMKRQQYEGLFVVTDAQGNPRYKFKVEPYSGVNKAGDVFGPWRKPDQMPAEWNFPTWDEWSLV